MHVTRRSKASRVPKNKAPTTNCTSARTGSTGSSPVGGKKLKGI